MRWFTAEFWDEENPMIKRGVESKLIGERKGLYDIGNPESHQINFPHVLIGNNHDFGAEYTIIGYHPSYRPSKMVDFASLYRNAKENLVICHEPRKAEEKTTAIILVQHMIEFTNPDYFMLNCIRQGWEQIHYEDKDVCDTCGERFVGRRHPEQGQYKAWHYLKEVGDTENGVELLAHGCKDGVVNEDLFRFQPGATLRCGKWKDAKMHFFLIRWTGEGMPIIEPEIPEPDAKATAEDAEAVTV